MIVSGAVNGNGFAAYLDQVLGPTPVPGDVVVLDHLPAHKVAELTESMETRSARLRYLPPHSPDFNLIEPAFSKLRTWLRTAQARSRKALEAVSQTATNWITEHDARNWVGHCGYYIHYPENRSKRKFIWSKAMMLKAKLNIN